MDPVYLDLHIHTSDDPSSLNQHYDLDTLIENVKKQAQGADFLISLTDHNTVNTKVYLEAVKKIGKSLILGVELHIQTHKGTETNAYHCHIYFNTDESGITSEIIADINAKLDKLYPNKKPDKNDKSIPVVQQIIEEFDEYDFLLLPHGGQTHATFDKAMPKGKEFDNAMERSIYYNFFDGFTSRSNKKTDETKAYLERLGLQEFINLLTCTDNYNPAAYPKPKNAETYEFIPTWMFATATFSGLRLSLTDSSRLEYSQEKPKAWRESIKSVRLKNDNIDIDVRLTPGLNVVIGESASGKTLFVDSLNRKLTGMSFADSKYNEYDVESIDVNYPDKLHPYYIGQNYVISVTTQEKDITNIGLIAKIIPENVEARKKINQGIKHLDECLSALFLSVEKIEKLEEEITKIPVIQTLITSEKVNENILKRFFSNVLGSLENVEYTDLEHDNDLEFLDALNERLKVNPFIAHDENLITGLKGEINEMKIFADLESQARGAVKQNKDGIDQELREKEGESRQKQQDFDSLIAKMKSYYEQLVEFERTLSKVSAYEVQSHTGEVEIERHKLSVENKFQLNREIVKDGLNKILLNGKSLASFDDITPHSLFKGNFSKNLKGLTKGSQPTYKIIQENFHNNIIENDKVNHKIITPTGEDFDNLSPGKKTAVILELLLNFDKDNAPLIIDQPEDNLATSYMNDGLVKSIKKMKNKKQIIFVSHNATIPMAGDAQNIILCKNTGGKIEIRSAPLEGKVDGSEAVDHIARIADGGKSSIKKRFKKYNLKKFK